jgi:hypothetical protein
LIDAIKESAKPTQTGTLLLSAVGIYLLATAFTADEGLLLRQNTSIAQFGIQVPVVFAFVVAPMVFVVLHGFMLVRHDMLATNLRQFRARLTEMVNLPADQESCRHLLPNVEFVLSRAGPRVSWLPNCIHRLIAFCVIALLPVAVLTIIQVSALRYQSKGINCWQRVALWIDLLLLVWFFYGQRRAGTGSHTQGCSTLLSSAVWAG